MSISLLALFGCSGTTESAPGGQEGRSACSTGPAYSFEATFPSAGDQASSAPECIPRCEATKPEAAGPYGSAWAIDALPSGACSYDGEACKMAAFRTKTCPSGSTTSCSYTGYECRCEGGSWRCYAGPPGASACICFDSDAGADGG